MLSKDTTVTNVIVAFMHNPVNKSVGRPRFPTLLKMQDQQAENAQCIVSRGIPIGHAALILPSATYMQYSTTQWMPPNGGTYPGSVVQYPPGDISCQQIQQSEQQHMQVKAECNLMKTVDMVLKKQIVEAIEEFYLVSATFGTLGFGARTVLDAMKSLFRDFGQLIPLDIDTNDKCMRADFDVNTPMEVMFKKVDDAQKFSIVARLPYSIQQLV